MDGLVELFTDAIIVPSKIAIAGQGLLELDGRLAG